MATATKIPQYLAKVDPRVWVISVLRMRFGDVMAYVPAALDENEIDGVHDMRVSIRRLRGALNDFSQISDKFPLAKVNKPLKALADSLGEVRDIDVALVSLLKAGEDADDLKVKEGLGQMIEEYTLKRADAFQDLQKALADNALTQLRTRFDHAFDESMCERDLVGASSVEKAGREIIGECLSGFESLSDCIYHPFALKGLHRLRIAGKHLRYALELFSETFGEKLSPFAESVKSMQEHLGDVHDCDIWIDQMSNRLTAIKRKKRTLNPERAAATFLLAEFVRRRIKAYRAALELWSDWESQAFIKNLQAALEPASKNKAASAAASG